MTWNPDPGAPLSVSYERDPIPAVLCSYTPDDALSTVTGYRWEPVDELPEGVLVRALPGGVELSAEDAIGAFADVTIGYIMGDNTHGQVSKWEDLPADAVDVHTYRPPAVTSVDLRFRAIAETDLKGDVEATFHFTVRFNHTDGKIRLQREIEARRRGPK